MPEEYYHTDPVLRKRIQRAESNVEKGYVVRVTGAFFSYQTRLSRHLLHLRGIYSNLLPLMTTETILQAGFSEHCVVSHENMHNSTNLSALFISATSLTMKRRIQIPFSTIFQNLLGTKSFSRGIQSTILR